MLPPSLMVFFFTNEGFPKLNTILRRVVFGSNATVVGVLICEEVFEAYSKSAKGVCTTISFSRRKIVHITIPLQRVPYEVLPMPALPLASLGRRQRCQDAAEPPAPWPSSPAKTSPWNAPSSYQLPVYPDEMDGVAA